MIFLNPIVRHSGASEYAAAFAVVLTKLNIYAINKNVKLNLAIVLMAASVILAMTLAAASSVEGFFIEEPAENETIEKIVQVASEVSDLEAPNGCYLVNASIVGNYYVAYYSTDDGSSARSNHIDLGRPLPQWTEYYVLVHRLGSNETIIYDPRVWVLSNEYGKG